MNSQLYEVVTETYRQIGLPDEWTPAQQQAFLRDETARLSQLIVVTSAQMQDTVTTEWKKQHGSDPDYTTHMGLLRQAQAQAQEIVLTEELFSLIPPPEDELVSIMDPAAAPTAADIAKWEPSEEELAAHRLNPDRWKTPYRSDPSEEIEALVEKVWPDRGHWFQIRAEFLLQARSEDQLPLPTGPQDRLAAELEALVDHALKDSGLPVDE